MISRSSRLRAPTRRNLENTCSIWQTTLTRRARRLFQSLRRFASSHIGSCKVVGKRRTKITSTRIFGVGSRPHKGIYSASSRVATCHWGLVLTERPCGRLKRWLRRAPRMYLHHNASQLASMPVAFHAAIHQGDTLGVRAGRSLGDLSRYIVLDRILTHNNSYS